MLSAMRSSSLAGSEQPADHSVGVCVRGVQRASLSDPDLQGVAVSLPHAPDAAPALRATRVESFVRPRDAILECVTRASDGEADAHRWATGALLEVSADLVEAVLRLVERCV